MVRQNYSEAVVADIRVAMLFSWESEVYVECRKNFSELERWVSVGRLGSVSGSEWCL